MRAISTIRIKVSRYSAFAKIVDKQQRHPSVILKYGNMRIIFIIVSGFLWQVTRVGIAAVQSSTILQRNFCVIFAVNITIDSLLSGEV